MSESKTIKGQVWIQHISDYPRKDSLVQEQLLVIPKQDITTNTVTLIENIWDDLKSDGTYKWNGKKYFYWEYKMTDTENEDVEVTVKFECPRPYNDFFSEETVIISLILFFLSLKYELLYHIFKILYSI